MVDPHAMMKVLETHTIKCPLGLDREGIRGGLIVGGEYAWFTDGADIVLYSKTTGCVESSRSFGVNAPTDNSMEITYVQELHKSEKTMNILLVGCSCKSFGILFVCQLPSLLIIRCIHTPSPISYISTINNESLAQEQLCDEFKVMSTILLVGFSTGAVFAVDLRKRHIENQLRSDEIVVNESNPSKLFIIKKNKDSQKAKNINEARDFHSAIFINENFCNFYKKQCIGKLNFGISCLSYIEEINAVAIGYITGHLQLWDCKIMQTLYVLKKPECFMPISHITFLEQANDPHKQCYLWVIQSDNSRLPDAMMIALSYEHRTMMPNGRCSYREYKEYNIKLKMSLQKDSGIGRCISALTLCNDTLVRKSTGMSENVGITIFAMLMEIRKNVDSSPKSYVFLFDINEWYKAKMPSVINHLKISKSYANFMILPDYTSCLDFNIFDKTLCSFGSNFRNDVKKLYYPSSIYFECECLSVTKIIKFKHVSIQPEVLDKLILKNWSLFLNPSLIFHQCLHKNLKPFFWDKTYDYENYTLLDKLHFVISIMVENNNMSVIEECAEKWKSGTHSEVIILHLVQCLWNHVMLVKQYADELCVPLFDCSGTLDGKKNLRMLNDCLSQILCVENFFRRMQLTDCVQIINVDLVDRVKILNLVTQYFNAIICFVNFQLLPKQIEEDATQQIIQCDFTSLIQYACKRRMELGDLPLYLIDAIVTNEPNGNKLIQQWKHECIEGTKGLYPPSDVQCLLRIYLNAELSDQIKDFITIYFLIDVCSMQKMDEITTTIFNDTFVKNEELYKLCCASWFFDHDMFEDAMLILTSNNEWMVNDESWNWYHWTVLKLFVFKKQYYFAQIYLELFDIKLMNLDDHKFYVNLQIMNNHCFDALCHSHLRNTEEKKILFEYIFDRCRHTNQLKAFLNYPMDSDEKELFFSCLKKFEDTNLIQFMFLIREKRYSEALEVYKLLKVKSNSKHSYILTIASVLVDKIKDNIFPHNKSDINKTVFCNEEINMTIMNCFMDNHVNMKKSNILRSYSKLCQSNLIVPDADIVNKTQSLDEEVSIINGVLSSLKIEKKLLKLLDTPFIQNISHQPSATNCSVVPKKKSATDNKQLSTINLDKMPQTLTFSLPDNNDIQVEKFSHKVSMQKIENKVVGKSDTNDLPINLVSEQSLIISHKFRKDNSKIELLETVPISYTVDREEYEKLDISDSDQSVISDGKNEENLEEPKIILDKVNENCDSEQPDIKHKGDIDEQLEDLFDHEISVENHSDQLIVIPDGVAEDNLEEPYVIPKGENYECVDLPNIIPDDSNSVITNFEESDCLFYDGVNVENNSDQLSVLFDDKDKGNLEKPCVIPDSECKENFEESDCLFYDDLNVENNSDQLSVLADGENEENLEETEIIHDKVNENSDSEQPDIKHKGDIDEQLEDLFDHEISVENHSDQLIVIPDGVAEDNLKEPYVIPKGENYECVDLPNIIPDDSNSVITNFEESDCLFYDGVNVENNSDQLSVLADGENEDNLEESDFILDDSNDINNSEQLYGLVRDDLSAGNQSNQQNGLADVENEENLEEPEIILDKVNENSDSEQPNIKHKGKIDEQLEDLFNHEISVENYSDQLIVIPDGVEEDNLEEPYVIPKRENYESVDLPNIIPNDSNSVITNFEESDCLFYDGVNVEKNSDQLSVLANGKNEEHFKESEDFLDDDQSVGNQSDEPIVLSDDEDQGNLEKLYVIPDNKCEHNFEESEDLLEDTNDSNNSEQPNAILKNDINKNFEELDDFLDDDQSVLPNHENEGHLEEPEILLDDANDTNNSERHDIILASDIEENLEESEGMLVNNDQIVENHSDQLIVIPDGKHEDTLEEADFILKPKNYEIIDKTDIVLDELNDTNNFEESSVSLDDDASVQNHSDQLSVIPDDIKKYSLDGPDITLDSEYKVNCKEAHETLKNEKSPKNNEMVDRDNVIYPIDSQTNTLENLTPCIYGLTEENHLNCDNQIIGEENKIYLCNKVDSNKTSFVIKNDDFAKIVENTNRNNKSSEPNNFQIVENPKDLCTDQNEDYLYDKYQFSNNIIFSELSSNENPIPEYGFNHLTLTENESNQLEMYDPLNQPTSALLNESFLNNISLATTAKVNETRDLVVDNNVEIVTDEILVDLESSSSNTNLYNQEIKSFQQVVTKDVASQQVDINILNSATKEYAVEIENNCHLAISSEPSKTLIIEKCPPNCMSYKDILVQEETSKLVNFVKSNSDPEIDKNLSDNLTFENNKQPLIEQIDKNIPNLRKRRGGAKCIPLADTKLITKLKSESKTKPIDIEIISSNISSSTSDVVEDSLVSVSKKKSKGPKKISSVKRRRVCPSYVTSIDRVSNRKIDLEKSGEITTNEVKFEKLLQNSMLYKDILVQGETSKLVNFVKSNSDPLTDKNLSDNFNNLTYEKNKQPLIEQIDKNIPNLRKRRGGAKCIPLTDTKLITKSKSENKTKPVDIEIISSNISSSTSDVVEDSLVSISKKRSKRPKKITLVKRRRVCPKYVASFNRVSNNKIDLEESGEITANKNKNVKKIEKLLPNNLPYKDTASQEKLKKITMSTKIKLDFENNNKISNQNTISSTNNFQHLFSLEPKIILEKFDVSLFKNCFKQLAVANDSSQVTSSTNKTNSQKPVTLERFKKRYLKSIKEPTAINTIIDLDKESKEDSINNDKNKAVTRKSKLNSSYKLKKVKLDKNLKSSSDRLVLTSSKSGPINCVNKIHNSLIKETIDLISDDEVQEEMGETSSDEEKLDWRIIPYEVKSNTDAIPKIRIRRNKSEINTKCVGSLLELKSIKQGTKIVQNQELGLIKKSSESKMLKLNQRVRRMSSRKVLKKQTCSCCTGKLMDVACSSNVL